MLYPNQCYNEVHYKGTALYLRFLKINHRKNATDHVPVISLQKSESIKQTFLHPNLYYNKQHYKGTVMHIY